MEGVCVFSGLASSTASSSIGVLLEAMVAAGTKARNHGFQHVLFLTDSRNLVQTFRKKKKKKKRQQIGLTSLEWLI